MSVSILIVGRHSLHGSLTFLDISNYIFKAISIVNSLRWYIRGQSLSFTVWSRGQGFFPFGIIKNISLWTKIGQIFFQPIIKHRGFINSGFLSCDTNPLSAQEVPGLLCITPMGTEGPETMVQTLTSCCLLFHE